ncbi:methylated-DNA--[protein]-cysteine S-methyltransferase [Photobacterium japonica]|uniref:methylated-DNA--[protein]-cysteine S-methyltransferase n=1 Tax=Photobacterium japonica TaxID=2910235 RepID=UPI003D12FFAC
MCLDVLQSKLGMITFTASGQGLTGLYLPGQEHFLPYKTYKRNTKNVHIEQAKDEISDYLDGKRKDFSVGLDLRGTEFQKKVWHQVREVPYAHTSSYKDIAQQLGMKGGYQAIGSANRNNPISIMIPCHRIIGATGKLIGYGGGVDLKAQLLHIETHYEKNDQQHEG